MVNMSSAAQVLRQAESLKASLVENGKSVTDGGKLGGDGGRSGDSSKGSSDGGKGVWDVWVTRQKLEDVYKRLLLMDLEYALDKKVEQDLWNHAFKNQITALQTQAKDKNNPKKGEVQANLNLFLETASGFYLQFLQLICSTFKLDLPFRRKSSAFGVMKEKTQLRAKITPPKKSSCLYICQYCLVHLGDIARYRQQGEQAQTYYRHAVNLSPQNGQPYNQLAILEVNRNNKLSSVFYYVRSLAVRHPFPVAATNLEKFYAKLIKDTSEFKGRMGQNEFVSAFLQFQALLHLAADLHRASYLSERILACLPTHLTSGTFSASVLVQCVAITIFTLNHVRHVPSGGEAAAPPPNPKSERDCGKEEGRKSSLIQQPLVEVMLSNDEKRCLEIVLGFTASVLELLIQHTSTVPQRARESATLPAIQVLLDWLRHSPDVITVAQFANSSIWGHLAKLLNAVQVFEDGRPNPDLTKYEEVPLPEDTELRCFQPIEKAHSKYSFSRIPVDGFPRGVEELVRCQRLVNQGKAITEQFPELKMTSIQQNDPPHINFSGPLVMKCDAQPSPQERRAKQNVAMQAIMKQGQGAQSDTNVSGGKDGSIEQGQQKYLLGTATSEPQFMKHGGGGSSGRLQTSPQLSPGFARRGQSPQERGSSPMQGYTSPRVSSPRPGSGGSLVSNTPQPQLSPPAQMQIKKPGQSQQGTKQTSPQPKQLQKPQKSNTLPPRFQQQLQQQQQQQQHQQKQQQMQSVAPPSSPPSTSIAQPTSTITNLQAMNSGLTHNSPPYLHPAIPFQGQPLSQSQGHLPQGQGHLPQGQGHLPQGHQSIGQGQGLTMQGHLSPASQGPPVKSQMAGIQGQNRMGKHAMDNGSISGGGGGSQPAGQFPPSYIGPGAEQQFQHLQGLTPPSSVVRPQQMDARLPKTQSFPSNQGNTLAGLASAGNTRHPAPIHPLNHEMLSALRLASQISSQKQVAQQREDAGTSHTPHQLPPQLVQPQQQQQQQSMNAMMGQGMARAPIQRPPVMGPRGGGVGMNGPNPSTIGHASSSNPGPGPYSTPAANFPRPFHPGAMSMPPPPRAGELPPHFSAQRPHPQSRPHLPPPGHDMGMSQNPMSHFPAPPIPMPVQRGNTGFAGLMTSLFQQEDCGLRGTDGMRGYQALSPLTIQPPKSSPPDTRISSSFQGHAEGTPKPDKQDGKVSDKRDVEAVVQGQRLGMPVAQPGGEYSLFASSSPWSMPLNSGSDSKSMTSSPFSSQASSMRSSPVVGFDPQGSGSFRGEGWSAQGQGNDDKGRGQQNTWTEPPIMTPLERLLEQQRLQRQTDPH